MLTGIDVGKSKSKAKVGILVDAREDLMKSSKVSATQCNDAALYLTLSQVKQVSNIEKATVGKEKEESWQLAVRRLSRLVQM